MAATCVEITTQNLQTKFLIELRPELAETLQEWFDNSDIKSLDELAEQIIESAIAEYRLEMLPPRAEPAPDIRSGKLSRAVKNEIVELYEIEGINVVELAVRFGVGRSTIRRVLAEAAAEPGYVSRRKPKSKLTEQQLQEISQLICVERRPAAEVAAMYERSVCYVRELAYRHRQQMTAPRGNP